MSDHMLYRKRPCEGDETTGRCPFRKDATPGEFAASRFEQLRKTSEQPTTMEGMMEAAAGLQQMFGCHAGAPARPDEEAACAGWLQSGVAAAGNISIRQALATGRLPAQAVEPAPNCPELFDTYDEMARVMGDPNR